MALWTARTEPLLPPDQEAWQLACWRWLIQSFAEMRALEETALVLPDFEFFPATDKTGHDCAQHLFDCVARLMSVEPGSFDLIAHDDVPGDRRGRLHGEYAAGTFSLTPERRMQISYLPSLLGRPKDLIGVFAHEVSHGLFATLDRPPPGGWDMEEFVVELMTVYFGFGLFGANKAFQVDHGTGWRSWFNGTTYFASSGYLSQEQWAFALAVFLKLRGEPPDVAHEWLGPVLKKMLARGLSQIEAEPDLLAGLRA